MRVFVTGATGLVGAHSTLALLEAGHRVRLLVRNPLAAEGYFAARGWAGLDLVAGDMRDGRAMPAAMAGCDAVLHAAARVSLDPREGRALYQANLAGVEAVIGSACRRGIPNIVYVSSLGALFRPGAERIDEASPLGTPREAYGRSKRDAEGRVRSLQARGHPIQITYPGGVFGPGDPGLSESNRALATFLGAVVPDTSTGLQAVDARDVARAHRYLLEHPPVAGEGRYVLGGHYLPWRALHRLLQQLTGRRIAHPPLPGPLFRGVGALADGVKRAVPVRLALGREAMALVTQWAPADSGRIRAAAGLDFLPPETTFTDTAQWLVAAGHLKPRHAGRIIERGAADGGSDAGGTGDHGGALAGGQPAGGTGG